MYTFFQHALTGTAITFALGLGSTASRAAENQILLGASVQITGLVANTGCYYRDAYQIAVEKISEAGGVHVSDKDYKLVLKLYDNQSNVDLSVRQRTQLVTEDKANFLLGPFARNFSSADSAISKNIRYQCSAWWRLRSDFCTQLQIRLRHIGVGQRLLCRYDRHAWQAQTRTQIRRAAVCGRLV